jgi:methionyl-tRNA formyltransferase
VYGSYTETVRPTDTTGDLQERLARHGARLLVETLNAIEAGALDPQPQAGEAATYAPKLTTADARIDWAAPARAVDRRIRAMTPAPGAWTEFRDGRLKLYGVQPPTADARDELAPGELAVTDAGVRVGTGTTALTLADVQPPGRQRMSAMAWARGARLGPAERLGRPTT